MKINLSPQRRDDALALSKAGDTLTINGGVFDFGPLPDGATLPRAAVDCPWLASDVTRAGGALELTLILPLGPDASEAARFPMPIETPADGDISLPDQETVQPEAVAGAIDWGRVFAPLAPVPVLARPAFCVSLTKDHMAPLPPIFTPAEALEALEKFPPKFAAALLNRPIEYQAAAIEAWRETKTVARNAPLFLDLLAFYAAQAGLTDAQAAALGDAIFAEASNAG